VVLNLTSQCSDYRKGMKNVARTLWRGTMIQRNVQNVVGSCTNQLKPLNIFWLQKLAVM
jgi:hypothetical protein